MLEFGATDLSSPYPWTYNVRLGRSKIETESIQTVLTFLIWSGAENRLLLKGLCNFPYKRIENEQNEKRYILNMLLLLGYEMFQALQTFRNTLIKMKILNNSVF